MEAKRVRTHSGEGRDRNTGYTQGAKRARAHRRATGHERNTLYAQRTKRVRAPMATAGYT